MEGKMPNAGNKLVIETAPWTNADAIRDMTDEELARFLDNHGSLWGADIVSTANDWLDWLRKEATDGKQD